MRILLVNPTDGPEAEYGSLAKMGTELPQLGLAAIAMSLLDAGCHVRILDAHVERVTTPQLVERIRSERYDLVGFSAYVTTERRTLHYAKAIKDALPKTVIVVGGPQATLAPERFLSEFVDYVFVGEADESMPELVSALKSGQTLPSVEGVLSSQSRMPTEVQVPRLVRDINPLPLIELDRFYELDRYYPPIDIQGKKVVNIVGARGCPYKCTFCAAAEVNGRRVRTLTPERFVDHIAYYLGRGIDSFIFYDDTFSINKKRVTEICREIGRRKLRIKWKCFSRVDCLDRDVLNHMRDAGCYSIMFGCESMNDKTLIMLKKDFTVQQSFDGIALASEAGLMTASSFMFGLPGETAADMENTINQVKRTRLDLAVFPIFEPYPGTPIFELCKGTGDWTSDPRFKNRLLKDQGLIWIPHSCGRETIETLAQRAFKEFYLRPSCLFGMGKMALKMPFERQIRFVQGGFDYFVLRHLVRRDKNVGSRYH